jgi:hypothetical protein
MRPSHSLFPTNEPDWTMGRPIKTVGGRNLAGRIGLSMEES